MKYQYFLGIIMATLIFPLTVYSTVNSQSSQTVIPSLDKTIIAPGGTTTMTFTITGNNSGGTINISSGVNFTLTTSTTSTVNAILQSSACTTENHTVTIPSGLDSCAVDATVSDSTSDGTYKFSFSSSDFTFPLVDSLTFSVSGLGWKQIAVGYDSTCGIATNGKTYCWGSNLQGQLGINNNDNTYQSTIPVAVDTDVEFVQISSGFGINCGVTADYAAYCWGANNSGALGTGSIGGNSAVPAQVTGGHSFKQISVGYKSTCAVTTDNYAYCWGSNLQGQLGNTSYGSSSLASTGTPAQVLDEEGNPISLAQISMGQFSACGLNASGEAYCWGANNFGQLGIGNINGDSNVTCTEEKNNNQSVEVSCFPYAKPVTTNQDGVALNFNNIKVGHQTACGVAKTDGETYCWGDNEYGQLGNGESGATAYKKQPTAVEGGQKFLTVSAGHLTTCAINTNKKAYCWGANAAGQLGIDTYTDPSQVSTPTAVQHVELFNSIFEGSYYTTCGVAKTGQGYCWGRNNEGQLGIGSNATGATCIIDTQGTTGLCEMLPTLVETPAS
ncbi:MAG: hypothetical protein AAGA27_01120 [Pseudomonadota bacterium]